MEKIMMNDIYDEITMHLSEDEKPSDYMNQLAKEAVFKKYPLNLLLKLKNTEQSAKYHPEGNVWNHTMLVLDEAAKVRDQSMDAKAFMWAALLHDIGKPDTTVMRKGRLTSYDHDKAGANLSREFLRAFTDNEAFIEKVGELVRYHMHILYVLKGLPYADTKNLLRKVDIHEIALLCKCDRLGRTGADIEKEEEEYQDFLHRLTVMSEKKDKVLLESHK
jgi:putative nucleotidyltransferase with HDIG domain